MHLLVDLLLPGLLYFIAPSPNPRVCVEPFGVCRHRSKPLSKYNYTLQGIPAGLDKVSVCWEQQAACSRRHVPAAHELWSG